MGLFLSRKKSRVAVLIHDGEEWRCYVMSHGKPQWHCVAQTKSPGKNPRQMPPSLLDFAEKNNAARVRVLLPSEVTTLAEVDFPPDLSPEEMQMVVQGALSEETEQEIGSFRVASAFAERFQMGAPAEMIFAASFENDLLENFEKNCRTIRIPFEGVGSLELALLGAHTRENSNRRFLFLKRDTGFYATHASDFIPMSAGALPLGSLPDARGREPDRLERAAKRFESNKSVPLSVLPDRAISRERIEELTRVFGEDVDVDWLETEAYFLMAAEEVAQTHDPGAPSSGGAVCGLGEEGKDPYRAGTWLFFVALLMAVLFVWGTHAKLERELEGIEKKTTDWKALQEERKKQNDILKKIDSERARYEKITNILKDREIFPAGFLPILSLLDEKMPLYTRLNSMRQIPEGGYELVGCTLYQEGLLEVIPLLNAALVDSDHVAELSKLERKEDTREQDFVIRITPHKQ
ncbi:MAG: hypothetical protein Q4D38_12875 [Planctomycetia bacterium]|nr:hypothetical protein [Planctomycetia bacterium]